MACIIVCKSKMYHSSLFVKINKTGKNISNQNAIISCIKLILKSIEIYMKNKKEFSQRNTLYNETGLYYKEYKYLQYLRKY